MFDIDLIGPPALNPGVNQSINISIFGFNFNKISYYNIMNIKIQDQ